MLSFSRTRAVQSLLFVIGIIILFASIYWMFVDFGPEPFIAFFAAVAALFSSYRAGDKDNLSLQSAPYDFDSSNHKRNRAGVLQKVQNFWIKGILEQSLNDVVRLELRKKYSPEAVSRSWGIEFQRLDQPVLAVSQKTPLIDIFRDCGNDLLILGEPGSGKTIALLELARDLIAEAKLDDSHPIPLVFNLSSWGHKRPAFNEWLINEINKQYQVSKRVARVWLEEGIILLLLDGLDEVAFEYHDKCIKNINQFRQDYMVNMAVCSCTADYNNLTIKLNLTNAIVIQPLTVQDINEYLVGKEYQVVREALSHSPRLQRFATSPLLLNIIALAYRDVPIDEIKSIATLQEHHRHLFSTYVQGMFVRYHTNMQYSREQALHWLSWLASQMVKRSQTIFYIERLQPEWLPESKHRLYKVVVGLVIGLVVGLALGLILEVGLNVVWEVPLGLGLALGLFGGLAVMLIVMLFSKLVTEIGLVEELKWTRPSRQQLKRTLSRTLILEVALILGLFFMQRLWRNSPLFLMQIFILFDLLLDVLVKGLYYEEVDTKSLPNQGVRLSGQNAFRVGLALLLVMGLVWWLVWGLFFGVPWAIVEGLVLGLGLGLATGLKFGGLTVLLHWGLRTVLSHFDFLPWKLEGFLNDMTKQSMMRRVGGGYIFTHRMLLEYFAELEIEL